MPPPLFYDYCTEAAGIHALTAADTDVIINDMSLFDLAADCLCRTLLCAESTALTFIGIN